ncbi:unspecified product [Leishmania tarentolae]|uniref:Unspecified product n=1 Tax=Leishmania tarentolae TaxID=5689 RepID=A0A640KRE9_LEITA|nr:unspecified product [Leishmania tarentolae]
MAYATNSRQSDGDGIVGQTHLSAAGSARAPTVRFSLLYQLRYNAYSITARNSSSVQRAQSNPSLSRTGEQCGHCIPYTNDFSHGEPETTAAPGYMTPLQRRSRPSSTELFPGPSSSPVALSPPPATYADIPLLSTMDKRELSKVVIRDAVFGRLLDLVPSRQHIQTAVWTLSQHVIQIDGAVTLCAMPRDARNAHPSAFSSRFAASNSGVSAYGDVGSLRDAVRKRVGELVMDARLFACLLQPYLGDMGCQGDVIQTSVNVVG